MSARFDGIEAKLTEGFASLRQEIAAMKVWALLLYFAFAVTMLLALAKGFKWF